MLDRLLIEENGVPIWLQIRNQILATIGSGALKPGDQVPTMRQVAVALKVNLSTVQQAYGALEQDGVIGVRRGLGTFVSERPPTADPAADRGRVEALARRVVAEAASQGIDPSAVGRTIVDIAENGR